jgi:hypothetical protein
MSLEYFDNFPAIQYKNTEAKNLLVRVGVRESTLNNNILYLPLTIDEFERPDTVSNDLYNNSAYDWSIRLVNKQVDPYFDWYLSTEQFEKYIAKKYGSLRSAQNTIVHYKDVTNSIIINNTTYDLLDAGDQASYTAITAYDYELELNELKKVIKVVSPSAIEEMAKTLEKKLNE